MKVYVFPASMDGCGYYRLVWPAEVLRAQGHDVVIVEPNKRTNEIEAKIQHDEVIDASGPEDCDVMVLQRVTHRKLSAAIPFFIKKGITVIIDMDDDLSRVFPGNPAHAWLRPGNGTEHNWRNAQAACDIASFVTTSTQALQSVYARHGRGAVIENRLPQRHLDTARHDGGAFGWTGFLGSHANDPAVTGSSVQRLVNEGFTFSMVGNPWKIAQEFRIGEDQVNATGISDIFGWPAMLGTLHVGMAPLANTAFNAAKSWLKPMELAGVGVPTVMSPRTEYRKIHQLGVGVLADSPKAWYREIKKLMTDDAWHAEVAGRSEEAVKGLILEQNAWRWAEVWEQAWQNDRKQHSVVSRR